MLSRTSEIARFMGPPSLCSELIITEYVALYSFRAVINRCGVLTGPWQMGKIDQGFVVLWAARHPSGGTLSYGGFGGVGMQVRDLLHVEDLYRLVSKQVAQITNHSGKVFNVGGGLKCSVRATCWPASLDQVSAGDQSG
jgi:CDP-paratose 2-epimerase